tara:strand:+ start:122 stop:754 length:633 start_codon:yes stop_codon:yes gene_type:complete
MATLELNGKSLATQTSTAEPVIASTVTGGAGLSGMTSLGTVTAGNLSNTAIVYPDGHILQIQADTYAPTGTTTITTSSYRALSTNLEVSIDCASTDNYLWVQLFIPCYINSNTSGRNLNLGFRYSTDNWSSPSDGVQLGAKEYINHSFGYLGTSAWLEIAINVSLWVQVPSASAMKIQTVTQAVNGDVIIFGNVSATKGEGSLIVSEVKK